MGGLMGALRAPMMSPHVWSALSAPLCTNKNEKNKKRSLWHDKTKENNDQTDDPNDETNESNDQTDDPNDETNDETHDSNDKKQVIPMTKEEPSDSNDKTKWFQW